MARLASLDNARATLLLLGVLFHASVFVYLYQKPESLGEFLLVVFTHQFLHVFRMPTFFVIAGFFAAYLLQTRGPNKFFQNRLQRIALPLLIFWIPLGFANSWSSQGAWLTGRSTFDVLPIDFGHLWFLYFLILYCVVFWVLSAPLQWLSKKRVSPPLFFVSLAALIPLIPGAFDQEGTLATSTRIFPAPGLLVLYFLIFLSGALGFYQQDRWLTFLKRRAVLLVSLLLLSFGVFFVIQDWGMAVTPWIYAASVVSGTYGVLGLFLMFATKQNKVFKFVSDASYWTYLIHLPLVFFFLIFLSKLGIGAIGAILLTTGSTIGIGVLSYKLLVRHTPVSLLLNGRVYPLR
jgi:glucans biosynthesis protein C